MTSDLMSTALRLLAKGAPVTTAERGAAAGVAVADLANAPAGLDSNPTTSTASTDGVSLSFRRRMQLAP
jgi:hypothetical protein